jgi:hypothetical protein
MIFLVAGMFSYPVLAEEPDVISDATLTEVQAAIDDETKLEQDTQESTDIAIQIAESAGEAQEAASAEPAPEVE